MGLIKAALGTAGAMLSNQWLEKFESDSLGADDLLVKGRKKTDKRSSNTKGNENVITNGSIIEVNAGQCAIVVDGGKVVDVALEPGVFEFRSDENASQTLFDKNRKKGWIGSGLMENFSFGGGALRANQRVYYINTKEILGNKFGTPTPAMFRVVDSEKGIDMDIRVKCNGEFSYRVKDPLTFFALVGNVSEKYTKDDLNQNLRSSISTVLGTAFKRLSDGKIRPYELEGAKEQIGHFILEAMASEWARFGIEPIKVYVSSAVPVEEDLKKYSEQQEIDMNMAREIRRYSSAEAAAGGLVGAARTAAANSNGAVSGFMGMNMIGGAGTIHNLYASSQSQVQVSAPASNAAKTNGWTCQCGFVATGKFCPECGKPRPAPSVGWTCQCGAVNEGKFCQECGKPKPASAPLYRCDKCGWKPEDPKNPPKFCPNCGDRFDENDIVG